MISLFGQNLEIEPIIEKNPNFENHHYEFPLLKGKNEAITHSINNYLTSNFLDIQWGSQKESIFENVWATPSNSIPMLNDLSYKIHTLNDKIYALTLSAEGCGAYCEYFNQSFTFDIQTGKVIHQDTLFTEKGKAALLELLKTRKSKKILKWIDNLSDTLAQKTLSDEERADYKYAIELYQECVSNVEFHSLRYLDIRITATNFTIYSSPCFSHVNRALDELGTFKFDFITEEIKEWLSDYGRSVLLSKK